MKYFKPFNRHIWVDLIEEEPEQKGQSTAVLLPETYRPEKSEFALVKIRDSAPDCSCSFPHDHLAIVERQMIREIVVGKSVFKVVLENYLLGIIK